MKKEKIRNYDVSFSGLKLGQHQFRFNLNQAFFDLFEFEQDFESPNIVINIELLKSETFLEFNLSLNGTVNVLCDLTAESFDLPIENKSNLVVKFGDDYNFIDDEIWVIPYGEHSVNISQYIYEIVLLSIPKKRIHPKVEDGTSDSEILELLNQFEPKEVEKNKREDEEIDPRWNALKNLNKNN